MLPSAQTAWSRILGWGEERRLINIGTAPMREVKRNGLGRIAAINSIQCTVKWFG